MRILFYPTGLTGAKIADVELHFDDGPLAGLKIVDIGLHRIAVGFVCSWPVRRFTSAGGASRQVAMLRPSDDTGSLLHLEATIVAAWRARPAEKEPRVTA